MRSISRRMRELRGILSGALLLGAMVASLGCSGTAEKETELDLANVTYSEHVAPIIQEKCASCHQPNGIAPFDLTTYASARQYAAAVGAAVRERTMPPFLVETGGNAGVFDESDALTDKEIEIIDAWVEGDRLEGTAEPVPFPERPRLAQGIDVSIPRFEPRMSEDGEFDELRCFEVDLQMEQDTFVVAYEVTPGEPALVHHVLGFVVEPDAPSDVAGKTNWEQVDALRAEAGDRPGWSCDSGPGDRVVVRGVPIAWAPGQGVVRFPDDVGVRFRARDKFILQMHYNLDPARAGTTDQTTVRLQHQPKVEREAQVVLIDGLIRTVASGTPDTIEPGKKSARYAWTLKPDDMAPLPPGVFVDLLAVMPHMHERGKSMKISLKQPGETEELIAHVPRWDFNWQRYYTYLEPPRLFGGTEMSAECTYDTALDEQPVAGGWGTDDEMCTAISLLALPRGFSL